MKNKITFLFILLYIMNSCTQQHISTVDEKVKEIQQRFIVDKRLAYWNIAVGNNKGKPIISGATVSEVAYSELKAYSEKDRLGFEVELLPSAEFKNNPWGIVTLSACNIRAAGRHSAELVTQAILGTPVKVYTRVGSWYLIQTPDRYFGWVDDAAIAQKTNEELAEWKKQDKVLFKNQYGFAYSQANKESAVECDLVLANLLNVNGMTGDFYAIVLPDGRRAFVKQDECISLDIWKKKKFTTNDLLRTAIEFKGVPYLWGGTSAKMVDCSGFTKSAYYYHGILLQRDASQQTQYGGLVETKADYNEMKAGDLVFFGKKATDAEKERVSHVGICMGNQEFIHASGKVRVNSLDRNKDNYTEYYETAFVRARRIVENVDGKGIQWVVDNPFYKEILE